MGTKYEDSRREVRFTKLKLPYKKDDNLLTEADISNLTHQAIIRSAQYLWMAECYMSDLSKLDTVHGLDDHLASLSSVCRFMDGRLSGLIEQTHGASR